MSVALENRKPSVLASFACYIVFATNTEASPNQNDLNPNVTVGSLAMAMAAPGYGGPVPLRTAKAMLAGAAGWVQGEVLPLSAGGTTPDNLFCNLRWP